MSQPTYVQTHHIAGDYVEIDLSAQVHELRSVLQGHGRRSATVYKEGGLTVVLITMEAGNVIPEHRASGTTTVQVLEGRVILASGGSESELRPGQLAAFAPMVGHDLRALEPAAVLLTVAAIAEGHESGDVVPERGPVTA